MVNNNNIVEIPKTYTVSYFNEQEWDKDLSVEELEQREILYEAYRRDMALYGPQCGPGFGEWLAKVAITTTAGIVLGPAAIPVGAAVWGASTIAKECCDNEEDKKVFGFISDCGGGVAVGGVLGGAVDLAVSSTTKAIGHQAAREIASHGRQMTNGAKVLINTGRVVKTGKKIYDFYDDYGQPTWELIQHQRHKDRGIDYDSNCEVCIA